MRHQLKAVFDDRGKAQQALDRLLGSGYTSAEALLIEVPGATDIKRSAAVMWREHSSTSPARFLSQLLDHQHSDPARAYTALHSPGSYLLTLATDSESEADRAASLISSFVRTDNEGAGTSASAKRTNAAPDGHRGRAAPGPLRYYARESSQYFGTRKANDRATTGTTAGKPMLSAGPCPGTPRDGRIVQEVRTDSGDDEGGAPTAFRFARHLHENERFRNRSWNEAAGDLKVLWEAHDPAGPDWESSESALHLGWDSTRPEIDDDSYRRSHWNTSYVKHSAQPRAEQALGPIPTSAGTKAAWKGKHPGELTPWENFMDAVKHGWERIRLGDDMDEAAYRLHHARTYPHSNYDDIAPVYRYGNNIHRRSALQGRSWDAVEPELRAEWERGQREGKPLTWDETKAALQEGWDQAKS